MSDIPKGDNPPLPLHPSSSPRQGQDDVCPPRRSRPGPRRIGLPPTHRASGPIRRASGPATPPVVGPLTPPPPFPPPPCMPSGMGVVGANEGSRHDHLEEARPLRAELRHGQRGRGPYGNKPAEPGPAVRSLPSPHEAWVTLNGVKSQPPTPGASAPEGRRFSHAQKAGEG